MHFARRLRSRMLSSKSEKPLGRVDKVHDGIVHGWVHDHAQAQRRWLVDVFVDGAFRGQTLAHLRRDDLVAAKVGDGAHAFTLNIGNWNDGQNLDAVALGNRRFTLGTQAGSPSGSCVNEYLRDPWDYLRVTFQLDSEWPCVSMNSIASAEGRRRFFEKLFDHNQQPSVRNLGGYQALIQHRWQFDDVAEPILSRAQLDDFLSWYISTYGATRRPLRAPLGPKDIEHLGTADPISTLSNAQRLFANCFASPSSGGVLERTFLWCTHEAAALGVEDCLIFPHHRQMLGSPIEGMEDVDFPLNHFMSLFIRQNPFLSGLPVANANDRCMIYFAISLFAAAAPHYLHFIPKKWRDALFTRRQSAPSLFDEYCERLFVYGAVDRVKNWKRQIEWRQFDLEKDEFRTRTPEGSRIHAAALSFVKDEMVDIQLIGPFTRALGVGQSCRRLADALQTTRYRLRFCDFTLDHPNQPITQKLPLSPAGRARINIVHLNLDEFPDVVAYWPDVFSESYNVIFPYLEIAPPAPPQLLALRMVNETWAASQFIVEALSCFSKTFFVGSHCDDLQKIGHGRARSLAYGDIPATDFIFLTAGDALSGAFRKNFLGTAQAFREAFPENCKVRLIIKTHSIDKIASAPEKAVWRALQQLTEEDPRITIINHHLSTSVHSALIEGADAFISMHRSEGLGYHILEAMQLETPVVATAYSGNADFCNDQTTFLVPHRLVPVPGGHYVRVSAGQTWAEPDINSAAQQLRSIYYDRARREAVTSAAKKHVMANFSKEGFARVLSARVSAILDAH